MLQYSPCARKTQQKTVDNASQSVKLLVFRFVGERRRRRAAFHEYALRRDPCLVLGRLRLALAFIAPRARIQRLCERAGRRRDLVRDAASRCSSPRGLLVSRRAARPRNRHGAMALLHARRGAVPARMARPLPRVRAGRVLALIGAFLSSTPPFQKRHGDGREPLRHPGGLRLCRGVGSVSYAAAVLLLGVLERHAPTLLLPVFAALTACGLIAMAASCLPERPDEAADRPAEHRSIAAVLRSHPRFARSPCSAVCSFSSPTPSPTPT